MKKNRILIAVLAMLVGVAAAAPVESGVAERYGKLFVQHTLGHARAQLTLCYTQTSERGTPCLYVFNYDHGYVVVSADDRAHPILGYSEGNAFDVNDIPEGLQYYLGYYARQIQYAIDNDLPVEAEIAAQWDLLGKEGIISRTRMDKAVTPLLSTTWDQGFPYNYYAPACNNFWTGNHCYAGCVACSMSQVMKYWNWPETGVGEHSYSSSTYGGTLSVNFGEATYDWANMPNSLGSSATPAAQAVALLMYHCGVAVDMDYDPSGSGAHTEDVADAVKTYFRYASCTDVKYRDYFEREEWEDMLIEQLDKGIPMVYAGTLSNGSGGHAFCCDGYNNNRYFHFNWGWSGTENNYYQVEALNTSNGTFNYYQRVVANMIPDYIYATLVPALESLEVHISDALTLQSVVTVNVPVASVTGAVLTAVDQVVLMRDGEVIHTFENPQPGETLSFEDQVDGFGYYKYTVYGVNHGMKGDDYDFYGLYGPHCIYKAICTTTNFQGWNGGKIQVVGNNGKVIKEICMTNSSPLSELLKVPVGDISLEWIPASSVVSTMTIMLKNSANQTVYNFSGNSNQLNGTLYSGNNDCEGCLPPSNLAAENDWNGGAFGARITWDYDETPQSFKVYRSNDGVNYEVIATVDKDDRQYLDEGVTGTYYYQVTAYRSYCESTPALTIGELADYVMVEVTSVCEDDANVEVYPNPVNGTFFVNAEGIQQVTVYNMQGQLVYQYHGLTDALRVDVAGLPSGIYSVVVASNAGTISQRVTITH